MKKLFSILIGIAALGACQPKTPPTEKAAVPPVAAVQNISAATKPNTASVASDTVASGLPSLFTAGDTLTAPMRGLLRKYDLSKLWQGNDELRQNYPVLQGFFGPDHYRFALAFSEVHRDEQHPDWYHVRGRCRYRKNIRPFNGIITVRNITDAEVYYSPSADGLYPADTTLSPDIRNARYEAALRQTSCYSLRAEIQLRETAAANSGIFSGEAFLNFYTAPHHAVGYASAPALTEDEPARGSWILVRGSRQNTTNQQIKKFIVADDVFAAAPDVYKDFGIGDRGGTINPKYAKLGWSELWENDEWWADSPKPSLNL